MMVSNLGIRETRWGRAAILGFALWTIMTCFVCFQKPDFMNLTVSILGLFLLLDPQQVKQSYLRMLVFVMPFTWAYDLLWVFKKSGEYWEDKGEGGMA
mmetsp:Transcript_20856/g.32190  ORF Transcript_20856/g.32190 Transcript_20856/m.32190 type:complete len:98 (+) Transcript_20856:1561-1854(+)